MATDKKISIKIKADAKNAESEIEKLTSKINSLGKSKTISSLNKINGSISLIGKTFGIVTSSIKMATSVIKDFNNASLKQIKAEKQLETAAKNNPYLNSQSVKSLKSFASELQNIGTIGDEELLPLMAQLAAAGRTQTEIQDIMSAALDVSASGAMSMESAVKNLNKTFSGLSGELGESIPQIKNLTTEQLKNGDAVKVIAEQYKGMAKETTEATGRGVQLTNAIGDLKEALGVGFTAILAPIQATFTKIVQSITSVISGFNYLIGLSKDTDIKGSDKTKRILDETNLEIEENQKKLDTLKKQQKNYNVSYRALYEENEKRISEIRAIKAKERTEAEKAELRELLKQRKTLIQEAENEEAISANPGQNIGDNSSEIAETQNKINELIVKKTELETQYNKELKKEQSITEKVSDAVSKIDYTKQEELIKKWAEDSITELQKMRNELAELERIKEQVLNGEIKIDINTSEIDKAISNIKESLQKGQFQQVAQDVSSVLGTVSSGLNNISTYYSQILDGRLSDVEEEAEEETDRLKMQYEKGLISYEEYCTKKDELDKKAAQKEYKIKLSEWRMQLAMASVNAAQAVANALASGTPPLNVINAVTAGLLGAAQVATIAGNKPTAPSFSTGGFLTGNSTQGDKIAFNGNAGEAILNPAEQRNFMKLANGEVSSAPIMVNMPITIENNASNEVGVTAQNDYNSIKITVDKIVNAGLQNGTYNNSLAQAQSSMKGSKWL